MGTDLLLAQNHDLALLPKEPVQLDALASDSVVLLQNLSELFDALNRGTSNFDFFIRSGLDWDQIVDF